MKKVKVLVQLGVGLLITCLIAWYQGAFVATKASDIIMAIGDGIVKVFPQRQTPERHIYKKEIRIDCTFSFFVIQ